MKMLVLASLIATLMVAGSACGEVIPVTSFGQGATRSQAIKAGRRQAVKDAIESSLSEHGTTSGIAAASQFGKIRWARTINVAKLDSGFYEAEVEAEVAISGMAHTERRKKVALISDLISTEARHAEPLLSAVKEQLATSPRLAMIDSTDAAVLKAIERLKSVKQRDAIEDFRTRKGVSIDFLCVIADAAPSHTVTRTGVERLEMKARISIIDVASAEVKQVRTIKVVVSGPTGNANEELVRDTSRQIARVVMDYIGPQFDEDNSAQIITVPTAGVKLTVGQPVLIYKHSDKHSAAAHGASTLETMIATGEVIRVGQSYARVASEEILSRSDPYIVKPIMNGKQHGVVSDSDW